ncbi:MAG: glutamate 5-kinase [Firmicutes bacterium]|nr:glutamate 5-kinase [Bacillota bacterium]
MNKKLIVVKVGTSSITDREGNISREKLFGVVRQIADLRDEGHSVIVVSSGSIAAGFRRLGYTMRPTTVMRKQAAAAAGQGLLMEMYTEALDQRGYVSAQILLTRADFTDMERYRNAFNALGTLLKAGAVPIIIENDSVATEEIKLGDNDTLSAQVAGMLHADLLVLLTDVDGLYTSDPSREGASRIPVVERITKDIEKLAGGAGSGNGTGGMKTKISAARFATTAGVPVFICSYKDEDSVKKAVAGSGSGTLFTSGSRLKTRLQWMAFYAQPKGNLYVDRGAAEAITEKGKSLLRKGVVAVEGDFGQGDVVNILMSETHERLGKGTASCSSNDLRNGAETVNEVVHKDNMAVNIYDGI